MIPTPDPTPSSTRSHTGIADDAPVLIGTDGDDFMLGGLGNDLISGVSGNDDLYGGQGNDELDGGAGNDQLHGQAGNDVLLGGPGMDFLSGGAGNNVLRGGADADLYLVGGFESHDLIDNAAGGAAPGDADMIMFNLGISLSQVALQREGDDLMINIASTKSSARVLDYFSSDGDSTHAINRLMFDEGSVWDVADVKARVLRGSPGDDRLIGYATADRIEGKEGNDVIEGRGGHDTLLGGAGDDVLDGGTGHDVLYGGSGNDRLSGGAGSDYYFFERGTGHDVIVSTGNTEGDADCLHFGENIDESQIWFRRVGDDLAISLIGSRDSVDVKDWFNGAAADFIAFSLANEKTIEPVEVDALVAAMAGMAMPSSMVARNTVQQQEQLATLIAGSWGDGQGAA